MDSFLYNSGKCCDGKRLGERSDLGGVKARQNRFGSKSAAERDFTYLGKEIDQNGVLLSGGELQKLFWARALYRNPKLILLDEPTAALDALAEDQLYQAYHKMTEKKSAMFISHRLASTRFCDTILMLENGKIVESGTHEELLAKKGSYAKLFEVQSRYYREGQENG